MIAEHSTVGCLTVEIRRPGSLTEAFVIHHVMDPHAAIAYLCLGVFAELEPEKLADEPRFAGQDFAGAMKVFAGAEGHVVSDDAEDTPRRAIVDYQTRTVELTSTDPSAGVRPIGFEDFIPACEDVLDCFFADEGPQVEVKVIYVDL